MGKALIIGAHMNDEIISLDLGESSSIQCRVDPLVVLSILETHFAGRNDFVVGALLGTVTTNMVEITNCYPVPHGYNEEREIVLDKETHRRLLEANLRIYNKEVLVGWFISNPKLTVETFYLHCFFTNKDESGFRQDPNLPSPLLVALDPSLQNRSFEVKAFTLNQNPVAKEHLLLFQAVSLRVEFTKNATKTVRSVLETGSTSAGKEDNLQAQVEQILEGLGKVANYIKSVKDNKAPKDHNVSKQIKKLLNVGIDISNEELSAILSKNVTDISMLTYLCDLVRTQALVEDKLSKFILSVQTAKE
eukprot:TRINITY_DN9639_c0_g2_i1.p1 TRINITY_DN9639_c0_g2~~TRINITY_DN9639_c0_g2_i1.p1  ORF type:complete len:305 (+),score=94.92 TRINITY_DN9639_c0_g2_i1:114-1028(+)